MSPSIRSSPPGVGSTGSLNSLTLFHIFEYSKHKYRYYNVGIGKPEWNPTPDWKPSWNFKTDLNPEWANRLEISRRFSIRSKSCVLTESAVCLEILKTHSLRIELRLLPTSLNDPTPDWNSSLPIPLRHVVVYLARSNLCGVSLVRSRISILFADSDISVLV